jgi:hypothetical protein
MRLLPRMEIQHHLRLSEFHTGRLLRSESEILFQTLGLILKRTLRGLYNFLKVDVWGIGATVWELLEGAPPFLETSLADRWQPLTDGARYSQSVHQFLDLCSRPAHSRPEASGLLKVSWKS